ncbi:MAG: iron chelate uptake ABC transporter family permease subunit [Planctomycetota bacterium]
MFSILLQSQFMPGHLAAGTRSAAAPSRDAAPTLLDELLRVISLADYNTRLVVLSTVILGFAAGLIGTFLLLRKRALMSDALSHATLPGIAVAFIIMVALGATGKSLGGLLLGATVFGLLGVGGVILIRRLTRLHDDAALGIVLSVFFGIGIALLGIIQQIPEASAAGLESFVYGKTASMVRSDLWMISITAAVVGVLCVLFRKEFGLLCYDEDYAATQGLPILTFDIFMLVLVTAVTVVGLQAVGLILIIALLIIPPAAARFWTDRIGMMLVLAATFGALCGWIGSSISALAPRLPSGAIIVLVGSCIFIFSMMFGTARGVLVRIVRSVRLQREIGRQNLLRGLYELKFGEPSIEVAAHPEATAASLMQRQAQSPNGGSRNVTAVGSSAIGSQRHEDVRLQRVPTVAFEDLLARRSWSRPGLWLLLTRARLRGLVQVDTEDAREPSNEANSDSPHRRYRLTSRGIEEAERVVRNHRLWEAFLLRYADIAPSHVDRAADQIEHILGNELVDELEQELHRQATEVRSVSPGHAIASEGKARFS